MAARFDRRRYLEELLRAPVECRPGLLAAGLSLQECFMVRQHLRRSSLPPLLNMLHGLHRVRHSLAVWELGSECARMGSWPGHRVVRSQSLRRQSVVQALLLAHQLEQLRDVPVNLPLLQGCEHLLVLRRWRVHGQLPLHLKLRLWPLRVSFLPSRRRGLRISRVRLHPAIPTIFLVHRQPLRKEVP